jgi:hypothetical protein
VSKVRTVSDLVDALDSDLAWRKKELTYLKTAIERQTGKFGPQNCFIRSAVALLYAHWEGFLKSGSESYLQFVHSQRLTYSSLKPNFVAIGLKGKLSVITNASRATAYVSATKFLMTQLDQKCSLNWKSAISTKSNLSSKVLRDIIELLGLDYSEFETEEKLIDYKLLNNRNAIAHGEYLDLDADDLLFLAKRVVELMEHFKTQIENSAVQRLYAA